MKYGPVRVEVIPHETQRYDTVGDYYAVDGEQHFFISDMGNPDYEFLVSIHEQIEQYLTMRAGIGEDLISAFDKDFENHRQKGDESEPGDSPLAPYKEQHFFATTIERMLAQVLGVDWETYDSSVDGLD